MIKLTEKGRRELRRAGCEVTYTRGSHIKIVCPNGGRIYTSSTPSDVRVFNNLRAQLKRQGVEL